MLPVESPAPKTPQVAQTTPHVWHGVEFESEETRPPLFTAAPPTETPPLVTQGATPVSPQPQLDCAPPATPLSKEEPLEAIFARLDVSRDGELDKAEVGQMLRCCVLKQLTQLQATNGCSLQTKRSPQPCMKWTAIVPEPCPFKNSKYGGTAEIMTVSSQLALQCGACK